MLYPRIPVFSRLHESDLICSSLLADGTSVFIQGTHFASLSAILNTELEHVNIWLIRTCEYMVKLAHVNI